MAGERWIFSQQQIANTPSRKCGIDAEKELNYRQQTANMIQDMGQKLQVTQLCINTAIVYMHRFYMFHSFTKFTRASMASACLFLAAKVEEQPRKLEHVIKVAHLCFHRHGDHVPLDTKSDQYLEQAQDLVFNENTLLQTLGFEITVDHPHSYIVRTCSMIRASKDLAQTSYFLATNSLHLTTMTLEFKPTIVACVCINLACKWASFMIPRSNEGHDWWYYVDSSLTKEALDSLTQYFLGVLDKAPSKLKKKLMSHREEMGMGGGNTPPPPPPPLENRTRQEPSATVSSAAAAAAPVKTEGGSHHSPRVSSSGRQPPPPPPPPASTKSSSSSQNWDSAGSMRRVKTESFLAGMGGSRETDMQKERERMEKERQRLLAREHASSSSSSASQRERPRDSSSTSTSKQDWMPPKPEKPLPNIFDHFQMEVQASAHSSKDVHDGAEKQTHIKQEPKHEDLARKIKQESGLEKALVKVKEEVKVKHEPFAQDVSLRPVKEEPHVKKPVRVKEEAGDAEAKSRPSGEHKHHHHMRTSSGHSEHRQQVRPGESRPPASSHGRSHPQHPQQQHAKPQHPQGHHHHHQRPPGQEGKHSNSKHHGPRPPEASARHHHHHPSEKSRPPGQQHPHKPPHPAHPQLHKPPPHVADTEKKPLSPDSLQPREADIFSTAGHSAKPTSTKPVGPRPDVAGVRPSGEAGIEAVDVGTLQPPPKRQRNRSRSSSSGSNKSPIKSPSFKSGATQGQHQPRRRRTSSQSSQSSGDAALKLKMQQAAQGHPQGHPQGQSQVLQGQLPKPLPQEIKKLQDEAKKDELKVMLKRLSPHTVDIHMPHTAPALLGDVGAFPQEFLAPDDSERSQQQQAMMESGVHPDLLQRTPSHPAVVHQGSTQMSVFAEDKRQQDPTRDNRASVVHESVKAGPTAARGSIRADPHHPPQPKDPTLSKSERPPKPAPSSSATLHQDSPIAVSTPPPRDSPGSGIKLKLSLKSVAGNDTPTSTRSPASTQELPESEQQKVNPMRLVLSKDKSGHYSSASSSGKDQHRHHKSHKHKGKHKHSHNSSSSGGEGKSSSSSHSRKRPHSPSGGSGDPHKHHGSSKHGRHHKHHQHVQGNGHSNDVSGAEPPGTHPQMLQLQSISHNLQQIITHRQASLNMQVTKQQQVPPAPPPLPRGLPPQVPPPPPPLPPDDPPPPLPPS